MFDADTCKWSHILCVNLWTTITTLGNVYFTSVPLNKGWENSHNISYLKICIPDNNKREKFLGKCWNIAQQMTAET